MTENKALAIAARDADVRRARLAGAVYNAAHDRDGDGPVSDTHLDVYKRQVPYFWGSVGIVYNHENVDPSVVEEQGWEVLRNTDYAGHLYIYDSERDSFMMAFKALGYSMNTSDPDEINACLLYTSRCV